MNKNDVFKIIYSKEYDIYDLVVYKSYNKDKREFYFDWYSRTSSPTFKVTKSSGRIAAGDLKTMLEKLTMEKAGADELAKYYLTDIVNEDR